MVKFCQNQQDTDLGAKMFWKTFFSEFKQNEQIIKDQAYMIYTLQLFKGKIYLKHLEDYYMQYDQRH